MYMGHGAPQLFEDVRRGSANSRRRRIPLPVSRGILIVSAHWEAAPAEPVCCRPRNVVYDFGGFDPRYNRMRYDTSDASGLTADVLAALPDGWNVHQQATRGLDHGGRCRSKSCTRGRQSPCCN